MLTPSVFVAFDAAVEVFLKVSFMVSPRSGPLAIVLPMGLSVSTDFDSPVVLPDSGSNTGTDVGAVFGALLVAGVTAGKEDERLSSDLSTVTLRSMRGCEEGSDDDVDNGDEEGGGGGGEGSTSVSRL